MSKATDVLKKVRQQTDKILLFHSATGKDSIAMLDICAPIFDEVVCVYMYSVKGLQCVERYIKWAEAMYQNCRFIQCPHFNVSSYVKFGYLGCATNPKQKLLNLADITEIAREKTGIEWALYGMKEADSLNRRVFLRTYEDGINWATKKAYPLHLYKHKDIKTYIASHNLITPQDYSDGHATSSGESIDSPLFLYWLKNNFPRDLEKVFAQYPDARRILYEHELGINARQSVVEYYPDNSPEADPEPQA